jgi:hypothetical protein
MCRAFFDVAPPDESPATVHRDAHFVSAVSRLIDGLLPLRLCDLEVHVFATGRNS